MAFTSLNADCTQHLLFYLDGIAVLKLLWSGDAALRALIGHSWKDFRLESWPFMKFPFSVFNLPNLRSFALKAYAGLHVYPLGLDGALPIPSVQAKWLGKFRIEFAQSFSVLSLINGVPLLDTVSPNLKSLHLSGSTKTLNQKHMEALPKGLEKIKLISRYAAPSGPPIPVCVLKNLPPNLTSLIISSGSIAPDLETNDYSTVVWPPHLTCLMVRLAPCFLYNIPSTLERLRLSTPGNDCEGKPIKCPLPTSIFPDNLTEITIWEARDDSISFRPTTFPPHLRVCYLNFDFPNCVASDFFSLPKSITAAHIKADLHRFGEIADFFPNLTRLTGYWGNGCFPPSFLENLPKKLVELDVSYVNLADIPELPSSIKDISIRVIPLAGKDPLPSGALASSHSSLSGRTMIRLPHRLVNLNLSNAAASTPFCKADFDLIPSTVKAMAFELHDIKDLDTLSGLPKFLEDLDLNIRDTENENALSLYASEQLLSFIPPTLISLSISMSAIHVAWHAWMPDLNRFTALDVFSISFADYDEEREPLVLDFLHYVPDTVTFMQLPLDRSHISPNQMEQLPKNLKSFVLFTLYGGAKSIATDQCFSKLPSKLLSLNLPRDLQGLTPRLVSILPPNLGYIALPTYLEDFKEEYYQRNALNWGDYRP